MVRCSINRATQRPKSHCRCLIHQAKLDESSNYRESSDDRSGVTVVCRFIGKDRIVVIRFIGGDNR